ncbi:MAG: hypothetical protein KBT31_01290, partial [Firmicutes bacterium]|nr:hypothetical protein [Candidatus Colimorpha enterica]
MNKNIKKALALFLSAASLCLLFSCNKEPEDVNYDIGMDTNFEPCSGLEDGGGRTAHVILLTGQSNC